MIDYFEHIDDYKAGKLSKQLRIDFEAEMSTNHKLKVAVDQYDSLKKLAGGFIEEETRAILKGIEGETSENRQKPKSAKSIIIVALAALMFATFGYLIGKKIKTMNAPVGFAYNFEEPIWPIERGANEDLLSKGINTGLNGDIQKAKVLIGQTNLGVNRQNLWISELFAYHKKTDSIEAYLPTNIDGQEANYRIEYLKIIALKSVNDQDALEKYINGINAEVNPYLKNLFKH